jgi:hypothetical protein
MFGFSDGAEKSLPALNTENEKASDRSCTR